MALFDQSAATYDEWCSTDIGSFVDELEKQLIYKLAAPQEGEKALDLGCGTGIYSVWLAKMGLDVTGVDISKEMLSKAKEKVAEEKLNIEFVLADIHGLPFEDHTFDLVVSNITLEFVDDPQKVVSEVLRVLKPGGRFVCGFIGKESVWGKKYKKQGEEKENSVFAHATFFTPMAVKKLSEISPEKIEYGLYVSAEEFENKKQALKLEQERAKESDEREAGYFACMWKKPPSSIV